MSAAGRKMRRLYKELLYMGMDYPKGYEFFREKLRSKFRRHFFETDEEKLQNLFKLGEYVKKELEALYQLKKYRTLKQRYDDNDKN